MKRVYHELCKARSISILAMREHENEIRDGGVLQATRSGSSSLSREKEEDTKTALVDNM